MAVEFRKRALRENARLFDRTTYGARPFGEYRRICGKISQGGNRCDGQSVRDDEKLFQNGFSRPPSRGCGRGLALFGATYFALFYSADGALAGSNGILRGKRKGVVFRGRVWKIRHGIVGKYGVQVQNLFKKLSGYEITTICPLHGPVLKENLEYYLALYRTWSSYGVESNGVFIAYTSVYGNTEKAVKLLERRLSAQGEKVVVTDLARSDMSEAVEDAFRYGKLVLATTTYNGDIFPFMREFIHHLVERNFQNRTVGFMENGSWAPMAARVMRGMLEKCKNLQYVESGVKILSALSEENEKEIYALADELCQK